VTQKTNKVKVTMLYCHIVTCQSDLLHFIWILHCGLFVTPINISGILLTVTQHMTLASRSKQGYFMRGRTYLSVVYCPILRHHCIQNVCCLICSFHANVWFSIVELSLWV